MKKGSGSIISRVRGFTHRALLVGKHRLRRAIKPPGQARVIVDVKNLLHGRSDTAQAALSQGPAQMRRKNTMIGPKPAAIMTMNSYISASDAPLGLSAITCLRLPNACATLAARI